MKEIARGLRVRYLLEGRVRRYDGVDATVPAFISDELPPG